MNSAQHTGKLVEHLFRREAGRIVSMLTRVFGIERLDLAEDVVQDALVKALQQWPFSGVPENPSAWILQVARNQALDILRREQNFKLKEGNLAYELVQQGDEAALFLENEVEDDQLRMMFACCHPALSVESHIALTLKTLGGFGTAEIARAFLVSDETIHKRLVRAKQKLREERAAFEIPSGTELAKRLDSVLQALYLLFNEGYNASHGKELIRKELCEEAIRLTQLLGQHCAGNTPKTQALLALMLLHSARFNARVDEAGNLLLLEHQNRALWDKKLIGEGLRALDLSAEGEEISGYHFEAGIAACHCLADSYETTNWERILILYDMLVEINDSPVVLLNRAVAIAKVHGPEGGIRAIGEIKERKQLENYYLLYAILADFFMSLGKFEDAAIHYRRALELTQVQSEQMFLASKLEEVKKNLN